MGQNPLRQAILPARPDYTLAVLIHLPYGGDIYHIGREDVIDVCLESMVFGMSEAQRKKSELMLYFNACDREVVKHLMDSPVIKEVGEITVISRNKNPGAEDAKRALLGGARAPIVAYSDDDCLFYPGWLDASLEIFGTYQNSMVTGSVYRAGFQWGALTAEAFALNLQQTGTGTVERGRLIPRLWEDDYARSIGRDPKEHEQSTKKLSEFRMTYNGVTAWGTGHHFQFVGDPTVLYPCVGKGKLVHSGGRELDEAVDKAGILRLATAERYTRHMGNVIDDELMATLKGMGLWHTP